MATSKGRKIGNKKKVPSQKRYTGEMRWVTNKTKKIERHQKEMAKKKAKLNRRKDKQRKNHVD